MTRFVPGDIVEIETPYGMAYVQVTHDHPSYPQVVRVLPGLHPVRPDLDALVRQKAPFVAMVQLSDDGSAAIRKVANAPIAEADRPFPTFKMEIREKIEGVRNAVAYWWFWDGDSLAYNDDPTPEQRQLPLREVLSIRELVLRLNP